jgi:hypothetical protein
LHVYELVPTFFHIFWLFNLGHAFEGEGLHIIPSFLDSKWSLWYVTDLPPSSPIYVATGWGCIECALLSCCLVGGQGHVSIQRFNS